ITIIDGGHITSVISLADAADSALEGFTITNSYGSAIYVNNSFPDIAFNIISLNDGGGFTAYNSAPHVGNNIIALNNNRAITCYNSFPAIGFNVIDGNIAGGIYCDHASAPVITYNSINNNTGPAINCGTPGVTITDNTMSNNKGGISITSNKASTLAPEISHNSIRYNKNDKGGGIHIVYNVTPTALTKIQNNIIGANEADLGGGIMIEGTPDHPNFILYNNTIADNTASLAGSGIHCSGSTLFIQNSIIWNQAAPKGAEIYTDSSSHLTSVAIDHSDLRGGLSSIYIDYGTTLAWGKSMIHTHPIFEDAGNFDYHLSMYSPCINRGSNEIGPSDDVDGDARPFMGRTDMGADEYTGQHLLEADTFIFPSSPGNEVNFDLNAGPANAHKDYLLCAGISGNVPGTIVAPGTHLPVNWDEYTSLILQLALVSHPSFLNFYGTLNWNGYRPAQLSLAGYVPPVLLGEEMSFAYATLSAPIFVSNPVDVEFVP
ncbi:MAG: right-handed parallel beta-helix repeat-containing protein, partial [Planctomycetota bacterium]